MHPDIGVFTLVIVDAGVSIFYAREFDIKLTTFTTSTELYCEDNLTLHICLSHYHQLVVNKCKEEGGHDIACLALF